MAQFGYDPLIEQLASYVCSDVSFTAEAIAAARHCIMDASACALMGCADAHCQQFIAGAENAGNPSTIALTVGASIRWLDFNDTWLAAEWGHPSDNIAAIVAVLVCSNRVEIDSPELLGAIIKAYEVQGVLALNNCFNEEGLDHVLLVRIASSAIAAKLMGASEEQVCAVLSHAFADNAPLRAYRHSPNVGSRKSWASGDAASRAILLARYVLSGESGILTVLSQPRWGFEAVCMSGKPLCLSRSLGSYVIENILFKLEFPAEFHGQTACEAALIHHREYGGEFDGDFDGIDRVVITTTAAAIKIIDKTGSLTCPADRDHCLQYMVAVCLLEGELNSTHYSDEFHQGHAGIDTLMTKMEVVESQKYNRDYLDPSKRAIGNAVHIFFVDGSSSRIECLYPLGHPRRRLEAEEALMRKFSSALQLHYSPSDSDLLLGFAKSIGRSDTINCKKFMRLWRPKGMLR